MFTGTGRQSSQQQNTFLREFLYVVRAQRGRLLQQRQEEAKKKAAAAGGANGAKGEEAKSAKAGEGKSPSDQDAKVEIGEDTEIDELALPVFNDGVLRVFQRNNATDFNAIESVGSGGVVSENVWSGIEQNTEHEENVEKVGSEVSP